MHIEATTKYHLHLLGQLQTKREKAKQVRGKARSPIQYHYKCKTVFLVFFETQSCLGFGLAFVFPVSEFLKGVEFVLGWFRA